MANNITHERAKEIQNILDKIKDLDSATENELQQAVTLTPSLIDWHLSQGNKDEANILDGKLHSYKHSLGNRQEDKYEKSLYQDYQEDIQKESIAGSSVADVASEKDTLGFNVYVEAIGAFLTNADTKGPLSLSIEGEWGCGKSSFMMQLKRWLENNKKAKTVWFNAWRHDKNEELWAAFAVQFVEELKGQIKSGRKKFWYSVKLMSHRFDWRNGWFDVVRAVLKMLLWIIISIIIWVVGLDNFLTKGLSSTIYIILGIGGSLIGLRGIASTARDTMEIVGNPLRFNIKKYIKDPNYADRVGVIEQFHQDFTKIIDVYAETENVFVFIDDLDRCEIPKAAELMEAINLLIGPDQRLIFILGMDRQKVAAGLAVKYQQLLPFVASNQVDGRSFGYAFIEKFIQLPFRIPSPGPENIELFLLNLKEKSEVARIETLNMNIETINLQNTEAERKTRSRGFELNIGDDSKAIQDMVKLLAPFFNYNPRRIKHFINLFRLKAYIANSLGLFEQLDGKNKQPITLEQLAKFVTIELRWPLFIADLTDDNELLNRLSDYAESGANQGSSEIEDGKNPENRWKQNNELIDLLSLNVNSMDKSGSQKFSLSNFDVKKLLQVSARTKSPEEIK